MKPNPIYIFDKKELKKFSYYVVVRYMIEHGYLVSPHFKYVIDDIITKLEQEALDKQEAPENDLPRM